jgi:hypothetical protein
MTGKTETEGKMEINWGAWAKYTEGRSPKDLLSQTLEITGSAENPGDVPRRMSQDVVHAIMAL